MKIEKILNNNNRFIKWGEYRMRRQKAQLILLAAITIAVSIVAMSLIANNLMNVGIKTYKKEQASLFRRYNSIRSIFLRTISSAIGSMTYVSNDDIYRVVNTTRDKISLLESRYGYNFNVEVTGIEKNINTKPQTLYVDMRMSLSSGDSYIDEDMSYLLWSGNY